MPLVQTRPSLRPKSFVAFRIGDGALPKSAKKRQKATFCGQERRRKTRPRYRCPCPQGRLRPGWSMELGINCSRIQSKNLIQRLHKALKRHSRVGGRWSHRGPRRQLYDGRIRGDRQIVGRTASEIACSNVGNGETDHGPLPGRVMTRTLNPERESWVRDAVARFEGPLTLYAAQFCATRNRRTTSFRRRS